MNPDQDKKPSGFLAPFGTPTNPERATAPDETAPDSAEAWDPWDSEVQQLVRSILGNRESSLQKERDAELQHVRAVKEGRDSLLRQLTMAKDAQQLGWVTNRFHTLITKGEDTAERMLHLKGAMLDALERAQEMFHRALDVARDRVKTQQEATRARKEHEEELRQIRRDADEHCRKLWWDTYRKNQERQDRDFRRNHMRYCKCGNPKPTGHLVCCECYYEYGRRRW